MARHLSRLSSRAIRPWAFSVPGLSPASFGLKELSSGVTQDLPGSEIEARFTRRRHPACARPPRARRRRTAATGAGAGLIARLLETLHAGADSRRAPTAPT